MPTNSVDLPALSDDVTGLPAAGVYAAAGFSIIPIKTDGSKAPDLPTWKAYQSRHATEAERLRWWGNDTARGIAVVWGAISGNGEALDFDEVGLFERFATLCVEYGQEDLLQRLVQVQTPSGGMHLYYRVDGPVPGNQKLAQRPRDVPEGTDGARPVNGRWVKIETLIETRGEGGYTVVPGSPSACHPDGRAYKFLRGSPGSIPTITDEERNILHALASTFNEYVEPERIQSGPRPPRGAADNDGLRPGDDYNSRTDYESLLERHGWQRMRGGGDKGLWLRPGKQPPALSATSNYAGSGLFYVFSSNAAPFDPRTAFSPFAVYTLLEHSGDYAAAARTLGQEGFGEQRQKAQKTGSNSRTPQTAPPAAPADDWDVPVPFGTSNLPDFPIEALPPALADYVSEVAQTTQVPLDMAAMMGLAVVSAAGARRARVQIGQTHAEPLNLYVAAVMEPGSRKSSTLEAFAFPLREAERRLTTERLAAHLTAKEKLEQDTRRLAYLRDQSVKAKAPDERQTAEADALHLASHMTEVPELPRLLADDVTMERLAGLLAEQEDNCIGILSAEGGIFGILGGRYSQGAVNLDLILKGHSGEAHRVDRVNQPPRHIPCPTITMGLAVQPDVLTSLADNSAFRGRGLLGRFLYTLPENLVGTRAYQNRAVNPMAKARYAEAIDRLLSLPSPITKDAPGARHTLSLCGPALKIWKAYYDDVEQRQADGGDLAGIRDWASKLAGAVARIAGNLHLIERHAEARPWETPITPETVAAAWSVGQYLIPHGLAAFNQIGADAAHALARRVLRWIDRSKVEGFSARDCFRVHQASTTMEDLTGALAILSDHGHIRLEEQPRSGPGRAPSPRYAVNPYLRAK